MSFEYHFNLRVWTLYLVRLFLLQIFLSAQEVNTTGLNRNPGRPVTMAPESITAFYRGIGLALLKIGEIFFREGNQFLRN